MTLAKRFYSFQSTQYLCADKQWQKKLSVVASCLPLHMAITIVGFSNSERWLRIWAGTSSGAEATLLLVVLVLKVTRYRQLGWICELELLSPSSQLPRLLHPEFYGVVNAILWRSQYLY